VLALPATRWQVSGRRGDKGQKKEAQMCKQRRGFTFHLVALLLFHACVALLKELESEHLLSE
jgi:hypothetical protein